MNCRCCGNPLNEFVQPSFMPGRPGIVQVTCNTPDCDLERATMSPDAHLTLTPAQIRGYRDVNRTVRERQERFLAKERQRNTRLTHSSV